MTIKSVICIEVASGDLQIIVFFGPLAIILAVDITIDVVSYGDLGEPQLLLLSLYDFREPTTLNLSWYKG